MDTTIQTLLDKKGHEVYSIQADLTVYQAIAEMDTKNVTERYGTVSRIPPLFFDSVGSQRCRDDPIRLKLRTRIQRHGSSQS